MPADRIEIEEAEEEGVIFKNLTNPLEMVKDEHGHVKKLYSRLWNWASRMNPEDADRFR